MGRTPGGRSSAPVNCRSCYKSMVFEVTDSFASGGLRPCIRFPVPCSTSRKLLLLSGPWICCCLLSMEQHLSHSCASILSLYPNSSAWNKVQAQGKLLQSLEVFYFQCIRKPLHILVLLVAMVPRKGGSGRKGIKAFSE